MIWWEFTKDNGDGSYSKLRFKTEAEANEALSWLEENCEYWIGDGDGVTMVDTNSKWFFDTLEEIKETHT